MQRNPKPFVVVTNPGTDTEEIWSDHPTFAQARKALAKAQHEAGSADVMRRLDDGTLTTEF